MLESASIHQKPQIYTDVSGLSKLKSEANGGSAESIEAVAEQFEALFLHLMLKSMRDANAVFAEGNYLNSSSVETYQEMLDQQLSVSMSQGNGIGLKTLLMRQLGHKQAAPIAPTEVSEKGNHSDAISHIAAPTVTQNTNALLDSARDHSMAADTKPDTRVKNTAVIDGIAHVKKIISMPNEKPIAASDINENQQAFIKGLLPFADKASDDIGVDPLMLVAQAALETGWGKHLIKGSNGSSSFNLFNIKAAAGWEGKTVAKDVVEFRGGIPMQQPSTFRAYDSFEDSFNDYINFIKENPRYSDALEQSHSPEGYIKELHKAGYATDPEYSKKVTRVFKRMSAIQGT